MNVGAIVSPAAGYSYAELRDLAREAERSGFESFWVSDHLFGGQGRPDQDCYEAWTLLAALARETERIRLGVLVSAAQYRNPALLAKIVAGVDQLSGGRVEFGIGAGWKESEYRAYGYDYPPDGVRVEQLREALEICRRLWTEDRATFAGKHYRVQDAVSAPKPAQRPHPPIWVGGARPRVMRVAAQLANGFDIGRRDRSGEPISLEALAAAMAEIDAACRAVGREQRLLRSHWAPAELADDGDSARALLATIRGFAAAGLDRFVLSFPRERAGDMLRRAGEKVLPAL